MHFHFYIVFVAALIPMVMGFIWYNPKVLGTAWMKAADMNQEKMKGANMAVIFIMAYILSVLVSLMMTTVTIHQLHLFSLFVDKPGAMEAGTEANTAFTSMMNENMHQHRHFGHGALHGALAGILLAMPVLGINAMFERKGFKYIAINAGYWIVTLALMGGTICALL